MKKLILLSLSVLILFQLQGQEENNTSSFILGGSFNFTYQKNALPFSTISSTSNIGGFFSGRTDDTKSSSFTFSPYAGVALDDHWTVGLMLDIRFGKFTAEEQFIFGQPTTSAFERKSNQLGIGFFGRYIFSPEKKFNLFIQPYLEYNLIKEKEKSDQILNSEEEVTFFEVGMTGGILYNVGKRLRLTLRGGNLSFLTGDWEIKGTDLSNDFSQFNTNFNLATFRLGAEFTL